MPAPTPRMQLMTMSHAMLRANRQATPLKKKIESPTIRILSLSLPSESFPESSTKGMISNDGSEVSIWISRSVTLGNTLFRSPRIGETASPGSDAMADTDQIASSTTSVTEPFPVLIFIAGDFSTAIPATVIPNENGPALMPVRRSVSSGCPYCTLTQRTDMPLARA